MTKEKKTAAELLAELESDPTFRGRRLEREQVRSREAEKLAEAEAPLVAELAALGLDVSSAWDLVNRSNRAYPNAVPVLVEHLQRQYPDAIRAGIARALAVTEARAYWRTLSRLYREEKGQLAKEGLAVAISSIATDDVMDDLIALAREPDNGPSRVLLLSALEGSHDQKATRALMDLGSDPELKKQVQIIFNRRRRR
jgi:hypothetical protein